MVESARTTSERADTAETVEREWQAKVEQQQTEMATTGDR